MCLTPLGSSKGSGDFAQAILCDRYLVIGLGLSLLGGTSVALGCMYIHEQVIWLCVFLGLPRMRNLVVTGPEESVFKQLAVQEDSGCVLKSKQLFTDYQTTKESYSEENQLHLPPLLQTLLCG